MLGQRINNAKRVVILVEDENGREYGWMIHGPAQAWWDNYSMQGGSAHAVIHAAGEFQRMSKSPQSREIEAKMIAAIELLEGRTNELPG